MKTLETLMKGVGKNYQLLLVFILVLLMLVGFPLTYKLGTVNTARSYDALISTMESQLQEAAVTKNKVMGLERALKKAGQQNEALGHLVAELQARPADIRYITRVETVIEPSDPVFVTPDLPETHLFKLDPGLVVGEFRSLPDNQYSFETFALSFNSTLVTTKKDSALSLKAHSSYDPELVVELPTSLEVIDVREHKLLEPHVGIAITGGTDLALTGSLYTSIIHPNPDLDVLSVRLSANSQVLKLGIDPLGYNLGSQLPIFTDLWIYGGASLGTTDMWSGDISIGTKF